MTTDRWQFWIDVGGTFTDCVAWSPAGVKHRTKVLSTSRVKVTSSSGSTAAKIIDPNLSEFPDRFWNGYRIARINERGDSVEETRIAAFDAKSGSLEIERPFEINPQVGTSFEIRSNEIAPLLSIRKILRLARDEKIPPVIVRLGTTRGTNAILTRTGARTAFVTNRGFADALHIGNQDRPRLFELGIRKREPLSETAIEIRGRYSCDGQQLAEPDRNEIHQKLMDLKQQGIESLAVCLLHAWKFPDHEMLVGEIADEIGFENVSLSHRVSELAKFISRAETTVLDAYLNPVLASYVDELRNTLGEQSSLRLINSAGGLMDAAAFTGKDSILSGPAGGVIGFSKTATSAGFAKSIGFDMGGTSTDVSRFDGCLRYERESLKSEVRIITPLLAIETVAAGGGSICKFDSGRLIVGPESAGANPGPACYGRGGPLTVTDLNLFLGRILTDQFPFKLDVNAVKTRLSLIASEIQESGASKYSNIELAEGFLKIANINMASAIRTISVAEGYAATDYAMVGFGGAAPQHVCAVADELNMTRILVHPDAGILSAYGIGLSDIQRQKIRGVYERESEVDASKIESLFFELKSEVEKDFANESVNDQTIDFEFSIDLRYVGTEPFLPVVCEDPNSISWSELSRRFNQIHQQRYGYTQNRELEIVAARVIATASGHELPAVDCVSDMKSYEPDSRAEIWFESENIQATIVDRDRLEIGHTINGPALIADQLSTTFVAPGWAASVLADNQLLLVRAQETEPLVSADELCGKADPTLLEIFNNHFVSIARQMGVALQNTSVSVNVKERLDFSCAIFDSHGKLVVNAPHIPVHLGAMGETVRHIIADNPNMKPGDVFVTNDPFRGGSHLPDVTVITPAFSPDGKGLRFFLASRAHHAEIGGSTPGSMPPFSKSLADEGVLISNFLLMEQDADHFDELRSLLANGPLPSRNPDDNIADIQAQVAANVQGLSSLNSLVDRYSWHVVDAYLGFIQQVASAKTRQKITELPDGPRSFRDSMDNGAAIQLQLRIDGDSMLFDFTGTDPVLGNNFNANSAIVSAAIMYCLRCMIGDDVPLNDGILEPVELILPECFLNPSAADDPQQCAAVVAGNVETSQRIVDTVFGALGICAASQGTMNNLLFGDETFGYYETICGGEGATPIRDGADAVHTHMTNTRMTDPEILELRFPVRLVEFSIRRGSGGEGKHRGGDGVVRRIQFLKDLQVAILSSRRDPFRPWALDGENDRVAGAGKSGRNLLFNAEGDLRELRFSEQLEVRTGFELEIQTPGGGGWSD